jgi:DMSO reductase family type II enzyme chaperone
MQIETLATAEELAPGTRSRLYRLLADGFLYPDQAFFAALQAGRYRDEVIAACEPLAYGLEPAFDGLVASGSYIDFQAAYLRLFEIGLGVPPCPLYSGIYRGGRKAVMEELVRFYNFFGLSTQQGAGELPDHLATELEFMHFLAFKELAALHRAEDPSSYRRAQHDFLERQLVSWLPELEARVGRLTPPPFYAALTMLANAFIHGEHVYLRDVVTDAVAATGKGG